MLGLCFLNGLALPLNEPASKVLLSSVVGGFKVSGLVVCVSGPDGGESEFCR